MKLIFASHNSHKIREIQELLSANIQVLSLSDVGFIEPIDEPYLSLEENALEKARKIFQFFGTPSFADDTGLEVDALKGEPGVHSSRYAMEEGPFQNEKEAFRANMEKLLAKLTHITQRRARFRTVIALIIEGREYLFEGIVNGSITEQARGEKGFGYDPVFQPEGSSRTFAEMDLEEKNRISHRARAFKKLAEFLQIPR